MTSRSKVSNTAAEAEARLSMATENYLLSIFRLEEQGVRAKSSSLEISVRVNGPSH